MRRAPLRQSRLVGLCLAALTLPLGIGCSHRPAANARPDAGVPGAPAPMPLTYYDAGGAVPAAATTEVERVTRAWTRSRVLLPPRVPDELREVPRSADPIEVIHYRPTQGPPDRRAAIVMSPVLANSRLLVDRFAARFANAGYHVALVQRKELEFDPQASFRVAEQETRLVVMRSRQVVDWLVARDDVDPARLGTFGISAGAIVSSMLAGADPRLRTHVWMLGGGPLADVMGDTSEDRFRDYRAATMQATGLSERVVRDELRRTLRTDPVVLAPRVHRDGVLLVLAERDRSVPTRWGYLLWEALGRPELRTTPLGHYTTFALLPWLERVAVRHFRTHMPPS